MDKRLIWNFELSGLNIIDIARLEKTSKDSLRWEARYFWPDNQIIRLDALPESFLNLAIFECKSRSDCYYLLPDYAFNIKSRRDNLLYKPLSQKTVEQIDGFSKKIILPTCENDAIIATKPELSALQLSQLIEQTASKVRVHKTAFIYSFSSTPTVKIECARLEFNSKTFFTSCIEGRSYSLVRELSRAIFGSLACTNYVNFLKQECGMLYE